MRLGVSVNAPSLTVPACQESLLKGTVAGLAGDYELVVPRGAFYAFPKAPWGTGTEFVHAAIEKHQLLIIPGNVFSRRDTHFRVSYAAADSVIERGIEAFKKLARK